MDEFGIMYTESIKRLALNEDIETFKKLLKNHDWYYMYSDDQKAWSSGDEEAQEINNQIQSLKKRGVKDVMEIYRNFCPDNYIDDYDEQL